MNKSLLFLSLLTLLPTLANAQVFTVLERRENSNRTIFREVQIPDLISNDSFDGKFFKIVKGKSNEAIKFDDQDRELILKAANVYWHLSKARSFWSEEVKAPFIETMAKMIVRIELTNVYDSQGHFANDNRDPQHNNALSIPAGVTPDWVPEDRKDSWGNEIWFRPLKKIDVSHLASTLGPNPLTQMFTSFEQPMLEFAQSRFTQSILERMFYTTYSSGSIYQDIGTFAGTWAVTRAVIEASKHMDKLFIEKYYYLDTAMVPEVIYHEFAHIVLSDSLALTHSTPVIEGMADYFAAIQSKKKKVYGKIPGYSNANPKNPRSRETYSHWHESNAKANADFVLSVLWGVRESLGEFGDKVIYEARKDLKTESATISDHLLRSILKACEKVCEEPSRDKLKLYQVFSKKGF
jgi:hypothetical protein